MSFYGPTFVFLLTTINTHFILSLVHQCNLNRQNTRESLNIDSNGHQTKKT